MKYYSFSQLLYRSVCHNPPVRPVHRKEVLTAIAQTITAIPMVSHRQALLLSSSNCHGYSMLEFAKQDIICSFLQNLGCYSGQIQDVTELVFIPYAQNDFDGYTSKIKQVIDPWGFKVTGIHTHADPTHAIMDAKAIFVGGGNTFLLLKRLYKNNLVSLINVRVTQGHLAYIGSSAGTNVATKSIHTTNDMPIVYPPTFDAIGIVPFNINPHYIEVENSTHKGETRDQRIWEYIENEHAAPVLGLREGSILDVKSNRLTIKGVAGAVLFTKDLKKTECPLGTDISYLLNATRQIKEA